MRIALCLYSATGNTRYLASEFADALAGQGNEVTVVEMFPEGEAEPFDPNAWDRVGFAFPVMVFGLPRAVDQFLGRMKKRERTGDAFALLTCGGMAARTDAILGARLAEKGLRLGIAKEIVCEDSFIPFRKKLAYLNKVGSPGADEVRQAREFARPAGAPLRKRWRGRYGPLRLLFHLAGRMTKPQNVAKMLGPRHLEVGVCTRCGLCARDCPTGAVRMGGAGLPEVSVAACVGCCACFNNCPTAAWRLDRYETELFYRFERSES
jgi:ferredoxin